MKVKPDTPCDWNMTGFACLGHGTAIFMRYQKESMTSWLG